jgi:hypothetical protein
MASSEEQTEMPVYRTKSEIAMAGLVNALEKCEPGDIYARSQILRAMKEISDGEEYKESCVFDRQIEFPNIWEDRIRLWTYVAVGGATIIIKLAKWVISRKGRKAK